MIVKQKLWTTAVLFVMLALMVAACGGTQPAPDTAALDQAKAEAEAAAAQLEEAEAKAAEMEAALVEAEAKAAEAATAGDETLSPEINILTYRYITSGHPYNKSPSHALRNIESGRSG